MSCHFLTPLKFVGIYQNGQFMPGKDIFYAGKNLGKSDLATSEKYSSYTTVVHTPYVSAPLLIKVHYGKQCHAWWIERI